MFLTFYLNSLATTVFLAVLLPALAAVFTTAFGVFLIALLPNTASPNLAANYIFGCQVDITFSPTLGLILPLDIAAA
jgi:hypothetical protein